MTWVWVRSSSGGSSPSAVLAAEAAAWTNMCPGLDSFRTTSVSLSKQTSRVGVPLSLGSLAVQACLALRNLNHACSLSRTSLGVRFILCLRGPAKALPEDGKLPPDEQVMQTYHNSCTCNACTVRATVHCLN